ncbi:signal recognition particle 9 kDa protein-domain-containing protein [Scheffersomyces xylosifermentans]|uniref:signal recognition particle 9 kDa protein-domain-containing protein n=1 Tax=Scheffersomyces xylosifermentans TaxID=1304137 RepID=UPI00315C94A3
MPRVSNLEAFIEVASSLLASYPSSTSLSITYTNVERKKKQSKSDVKVTKPASNKKTATNAVHFKLFEPNSGKCIKYNTFKIKELSRLLAFIGPRGVNVVTKTDAPQQHVDGLASVMSNVKYEEEEETAPAAVAAASAAGIESPDDGSRAGTPVPSAAPKAGTGNSKNKKKNKKKKKN